MAEGTKPAQPVISEYQGKPIIRIPRQHGIDKAKAIVKYIDAIIEYAS